MDRWPRRTILVVVNRLRVGLVGLVPLLLAANRLTTGWVVAVAAVLSLVSAPFDSAYDAFLPTIVPRDALVSANAAIATAYSVAALAAFGAAGFLFPWLGGAATLSLDAASFLVSTLTLGAIRLPARRLPSGALAEDEPSPFREAAAGIRFLRAHPERSRLAAAATVQSLYFGVSAALYVLYVSRVLLLPGGPSLVYAVAGLAALGAARATEPLIARLGMRRTLLLSAAAAVAGTGLLPLAGGPLGLVVLFILGRQLLGDGGDAVFDLAVTMLRQAETDNRVLGRVHAVWRMLTSTGLLVGTIAGGRSVGLIGYRGPGAGGGHSPHGAGHPVAGKPPARRRRPLRAPASVRSVASSRSTAASVAGPSHHSAHSWRSQIPPGATGSQTCTNPGMTMREWRIT